MTKRKRFLVMMLAVPYLGPYRTLYCNPEERKYYLRVQLPRNWKFPGIRKCFKNKPPCNWVHGKQWKRPHSICFSCWYSKRQRGIIPEYNEVQIIPNLIRVWRKNSYVLNLIGKRLHEILKYVWE